jgi:hypothetical protein
MTANASIKQDIERFLMVQRINLKISTETALRKEFGHLKSIEGLYECTNLTPDYQRQILLAKESLLQSIKEYAESLDKSSDRAFGRQAQEMASMGNILAIRDRVSQNIVAWTT